jgi:large subunit ribosomal protein L6
MSRIGNNPITVPETVELTVNGQTVTVKGPKGQLSTELLPGIKVALESGILTVSRNSDDKKVKAAHGLLRSLIQNTITGVTEGFQKILEVNGVGYKANVSGKNLKLNLGFSHDIDFTAPDDVTIEAKNNVITVTGIDKQRVGQVAAQIRAYKKPEPYKGKGIKYSDEYIIRKSGKTAA